MHSCVFRPICNTSAENGVCLPATEIQVGASGAGALDRDLPQPQRRSTLGGGVNGTKRGWFRRGPGSGEEVAGGVGEGRRGWWWRGWRWQQQSCNAKKVSQNITVALLQETMCLSKPSVGELPTIRSACTSERHTDANYAYGDMICPSAMRRAEGSRLRVRPFEYRPWLKSVDAHSFICPNIIIARSSYLFNLGCFTDVFSMLCATPYASRCKLPSECAAGGTKLSYTAR